MYVISLNNVLSFLNNYYSKSSISFRWMFLIVLMKKTLNVESLDDLDSEVENFTGYGNEPEYTEQEISK